MTLNCKVGDLAIVVRSRAGNEGRIVRFIELVAPETIVLGKPVARRLGALWRTDSLIRFVDAMGRYIGEAGFVAASFLRPIRPLDEPETITTDDEVTA